MFDYSSDIEYTKNIKEEPSESIYKRLTSCLHVKTDTASLTVNDIAQIVIQNIETNKVPTENIDSNIKDYIYDTAESLCGQPSLNEIHIQNKIVFAAAIRLKAEDYMISKLKRVMPIVDFNNFYNSITTNQTSVLTKKFEKLCSSTNDIQLLIKEVNLITPENIHLNSFMFEPLIDMSVWRLKKLYQDIKTHLV